MNHTQNFGLNKPLPDEFYDIEKQNENMDRIDEALKEVKDKAEDSTGSIPEFVQAETRENIKNGETTGRLFGKIARFFADLKPVAFSGSYSDLSNKPNIPSVPDSVKNPHPLSINGHSYDGSAAINAGTIGITYGGTGATTAEAARTNLGLGTAATQEIANNLTTTEAGYALDARQGKVLWDEVGEINSNLIPSGGDESMNMADMVQEIYNTVVVKPKRTLLRSGNPDNATIGAYESSLYYDLSKVLPDYKNYTIEDFLYEMTKARIFNGENITSPSSTFSYSYNSVNGTFTIRGTANLTGKEYYSGNLYLIAVS